MVYFKILPIFHHYRANSIDKQIIGETLSAVSDSPDKFHAFKEAWFPSQFWCMHITHSPYVTRTIFSSIYDYNLCITYIFFGFINAFVICNTEKSRTERLLARKSWSQFLQTVFEISRFYYRKKNGMLHPNINSARLLWVLGSLLSSRSDILSINDDNESLNLLFLLSASPAPRSPWHDIVDLVVLKFVTDVDVEEYSCSYENSTSFAEFSNESVVDSMEFVDSTDKTLKFLEDNAASSTDIQFSVMLLVHHP